MESHDYLGLIFLSKKETFSFINDLVALVLKVDTLDTLQTSVGILVYCFFAHLNDIARASDPAILHEVREIYNQR